MQGHVSQVLGFIWTGFQPLKMNNCEIRASITFWSLSSDGKLSELMKLYNRVWSRAIPKTERTVGGPPSDFYKDGVLWWRHHLENQLCHFILMKRFHFCLRTFWPNGSTVWLLLVTKYVDIPKKKKKIPKVKYILSWQVDSNQEVLEQSANPNKTLFLRCSPRRSKSVVSVSLLTIHIVFFPMICGRSKLTLCRPH